MRCYCRLKIQNYIKSFTKQIQLNSFHLQVDFDYSQIFVKLNDNRNAFKQEETDT